MESKKLYIKEFTVVDDKKKSVGNYVTTRFFHDNPHSLCLSVPLGGNEKKILSQFIKTLLTM